MTRFRHGLLAAAMALAASGAASAQDSLKAPVRKRTLAEDLQLFSQVLNQIRVNHPDSLDTHELLLAAIRGMVEAADPHSFVIPAVRLDSAREAAVRDGKLFPVPIDFQFVGGAPLVASVAPTKSAMMQDILPGDELVAADGRPIAAQSPFELDLALAGPKNSEVALEFRRRRGDGSVVDLQRRVRRERVEEASAVPAAFLLDSATGYVRVTTFMGDKVADDLHSALERLEQSGMRRLLLDLRANGGGRVDEAKRIAGEFLPRGAIVYTTSGRKPQVVDTGRVQRSFWKSERRYPIVVLVDAGTASASELVAGALQDYDRALIVGRPTFGKSLVMQGMPLTDGSFIELVVGLMRTPCGRVIQRQYHGMTRREYFREAGQLVDTAGRPSCRTTHGRTVYGGGGVVPDIVVAESDGPPGWLARAEEQGLPMTWAAGHVSDAAPPSLDSLADNGRLTRAVRADFRTFAASHGIDVPTDSASDAMLARTLAATLAYEKFGEAGVYRTLAASDPQVRAAIAAFPRAAAMLASP